MPDRLHILMHLEYALIRYLVELMLSSSSLSVAARVSNRIPRFIGPSIDTQKLINCENNMLEFSANEQWLRENGRVLYTSIRRKQIASKSQG